MSFNVDSFMPTLGVPDLDAAIEFYDQPRIPRGLALPR